MSLGGIPIKGLIVLALFLQLGARAENGAALFGAAAVVGSVGSIVAAGAQAGADRYKAGLSAGVAMYQTDRFAGVSEYQARLQMETALAMAGLQSSVNQFNQQQTTDRLAMQLQEIRASSALNREMDRRRLSAEADLRHRELDLQEKMLDQQFALAKAQAGGGLSPFEMRNSGAALGVRTFGIARPSGGPAEVLLGSALQNPGPALVPVAASAPLSERLARGSSRHQRRVLSPPSIGQTPRRLASLAREQAPEPGIWRRGGRSGRAVRTASAHSSAKPQASGHAGHGHAHSAR